MSAVSEEAPAPRWSGPLLDTDEAAARAHLARQTMAKQRLAGTGCPYIKLSSRIFYYQDELDAWIAKHRCESTSDRVALATT